MAKSAEQPVSTPAVEAQPQHILWVVPDKPDNISTGRQRIAHGLRERGHTVRLVDGRTEALAEAREAYDVVIGTTAWLGAVAPLTDAQVIVDYVDPIDQLRRSCGRLERTAAYALHQTALRLADGVLYVYDRVEPDLAGLGVPKDQTSLGVDYERFAEPSGKAEDTAAATLSAAGVTGEFAVYIGGLEPTYRIETMLDAFDHVDTQLVVAGTGSKRALVESRARKRDNITYLGVIDHEIVPGVLAQASAGICLVDDPHTVKVLEYAAAGVPVVHIQGNAEQRFDRERLYWCRDHPESVADAITEALDYRTAAFMRQFAKDHDYSNVIDDYNRMIQRVA